MRFPAFPKARAGAAAYVAVDLEQGADPVRSFDSFTRDLEDMTSWLRPAGWRRRRWRRHPVYWIPVCEVPDRAGFEAMHLPLRMTKRIGGRKSDALDGQRIRQLL